MLYRMDQNASSTHGDPAAVQFFQVLCQTSANPTNTVTDSISQITSSGHSPDPGTDRSSRLSRVKRDADNPLLHGRRSFSYHYSGLNRKGYPERLPRCHGCCRVCSESDTRRQAQQTEDYSNHRARKSSMVTISFPHYFCPCLTGKGAISFRHTAIIGHPSDALA